MPVCVYRRVSCRRTNRVRGNESEGVVVYLCSQSRVADPVDKLSREYLTPNGSGNRVSYSASNAVGCQEQASDDSQICD